MGSSNSIGNKMMRYNLATGGAKKYAAQLDPASPQVVAGLEADVLKLQAFDVQQEGLKSQLAQLTKELKKTVAAADTKRAKLVRMTEVAFGPKGVEINEFRPATQGKL